MEKNIVNKEHSSPLSCTNGDPADDGRVVSASDTKSGSPRFESRSDHFVVFVLSRPEFKPSTMPAGKNQLIAFCQLFFFLPCYVLFRLFVSNYLGGVPGVNYNRRQNLLKHFALKGFSYVLQTSKGENKAFPLPSP